MLIANGTKRGFMGVSHIHTTNGLCMGKEKKKKKFTALPRLAVRRGSHTVELCAPGEGRQEEVEEAAAVRGTVCTGGRNIPEGEKTAFLKRPKTWNV